MRHSNEYTHFQGEIRKHQYLLAEKRNALTGAVIDYKYDKLILPRNFIGVGNVPSSQNTVTLP